MGRLAVTWWGHSSTSVELAGTTVATDPLLTRRLYHLARPSPEPPPLASFADLVLISHLHYDHLHVPSLDRFDPDVPVVVPRGADRIVPGLRRRNLVPVTPGDTVDLAGVRVEVHPAHHSGARNPVARTAAPALGFRFATGGTSVWFPGDTGPSTNLAGVTSVDLAMVPIGGWGPSLGEEHLDPAQASHVVATVGAQWSLAVHYGTFWPVTLRRLRPANHRRLFESPAERFHQAVLDQAVDTVPLTPAFGERLILRPE